MKTLELKLAIISLLIFSSLKINAVDLNQYGNSSLREMNETMVKELYERTGMKHSIPDTLKVSLSKSKTASDKKKLINNLNMMKKYKSNLEDRVSDRRKSPSYNDMVAITITDVKVIGPRNYEFPNPMTTPMFIVIRGDQVNNIIYSDFKDIRENIGYNIEYRTAYSEDGSIIMNGTKLNGQNESKITFHVDVNNINFEVDATVSTNKNGWN